MRILVEENVLAIPKSLDKLKFLLKNLKFCFRSVLEAFVNKLVNVFTELLGVYWNIFLQFYSETQRRKQKERRRLLIFVFYLCDALVQKVEKFKDDWINLLGVI